MPIQNLVNLLTRLGLGLFINKVRLIRQYKQLEIFFVFEMRTESWNVKYLIDNEFVLQYM